MAKPLTAEQIEVVRKFYTSEAAEALFTTMEHNLITDWINQPDSGEREKLWHQVQAVLELKFSLRDAAAMKKLTERDQKLREQRDEQRQGGRVYQA